MTLCYPLTHPLTHHKSSNKIEFSELGQDLFNIYCLTWPQPLTHWSTHTPTHRWGCLSKSQIFKQNWIISIRSRLIKFLVIWPDPTHQPTHPPTHPPNYTPTHRLGSLHRFQIFKQNWNILICSSFITFQLIWESPFGGGWGKWVWVWWFINFKFSNRIEISWFVKVLSCFNRFGGPPEGGWGGVGVCRCGCGLVGQSPQM